MSKTRLKIGIVGAGRGSGHIAAIKTAGDRVDFRGVYDPVGPAMAAFASEYGVDRQYGSFEAAVEDCDLLILASPQQYHAPQAAFALLAGVHVLSEVPAAVSYEQVDRLLAAARASSSLYMIAENYCYTRENLIVGAMARRGLFGDIYFGESEYLHEMKSWQVNAAGGPTWRHFWQVGRNGITYPTHCLGPILEWMNDRIVSLSCVGTGRWTAPRHEMEDTVTLSARTRKGGLIRIRLDMLSNRPELWNYYAIQGTHGAYESGRSAGDMPRIYLEGVSPRDEWQPVEAYAADHLPSRYLAPPEGSGHWGSDSWPLLDFIEAIDRDEQPALDVYKALEMSLPGIVSEQSIAQGGDWLFVPDPRTLTAGIGISPGRESPLA